MASNSISYDSHEFSFFDRKSEVVFPVGLAEDYGAIVNTRNNISEYEAGLSYFIEANLNASDFFLDVGAQIGLFAILAATRGIPTLSLEMRTSLVKAHFDSKHRGNLETWLPLNFAVDEACGLVPYNDDAQFALVGGNETAMNAEKSILSVRLDDIPTHMLGAETGLIKIDVEGFEVRALRGARRLLQRARPVLCVECHPYPAHLYGTQISEISDLLPERYDTYLVSDHRLGDGVDVRRIDRVEHFEENFLVICAPSERALAGLRV